MIKPAAGISINGIDEKPYFDIIVIGSGPAGCAAAINGAKLGLSVLVLTRDRHVKGHSPGVSESLHPGATGIFEHLDALSVIEASRTGNFRGIHNDGGVYYFDEDITQENSSDLNRSMAPRLETPFLKNGDSGIHVNRERFNYAFMELAKSKVSLFCPHTHVIDLIQKAGTFIGVKTDRGVCYSGKYVVDATGSKRFSGGLLNLKVQYHSPPLVCVTGRITKVANDHSMFNGEVAHFHAYEHGWTWVTMEDDGNCTYTNLSLKGKNPSWLPPNVSNLGTLKQIRKDNRRWRSYRTTAMPGLLLCGDAGFTLDPATGQGILTALNSGIRASETIFRCLLEPDDETTQLRSYDQWFGEQVKRKVAQLTSYYSAYGIEF